MNEVIPTPAASELRTSRVYAAVKRGWPGQAILACSGGVDSTALLLVAACAVQRGDIRPFVVVHVDHRTRPETEREGEFVADLCAKLEQPLVRVRIDPDALLEPGGRSIEDELRGARYDALALVARRLGIEHVVTAHTRDDQVETVLLRLLSGAGALAAAGMRSVQALETRHGPIEVIRPLLDVSRAELEAVLAAAGVQPCHDPSNRDIRFRRNALRQQVLPLLRQRFPGFDGALVRSVRLAARDADLADRLADDLWAQVIVEEGSGSISLDRKALVEAHPALATRLIQRAARLLAGTDSRELSFERIESVRLAAGGRTGARIELPHGVIVRIERERVTFERRDDADDADRA